VYKGYKGQLLFELPELSTANQAPKIKSWIEILIKGALKKAG
jgi:hypothetical protein